MDFQPLGSNCSCLDEDTGLINISEMEMRPSHNGKLNWTRTKLQQKSAEKHTSGDTFNSGFKEEKMNKGFEGKAKVLTLWSISCYWGGMATQ